MINLVFKEPPCPIARHRQDVTFIIAEGYPGYGQCMPLQWLSEKLPFFCVIHTHNSMFGRRGFTGRSNKSFRVRHRETN